MGFIVKFLGVICCINYINRIALYRKYTSS